MQDRNSGIPTPVNFESLKLYFYETFPAFRFDRKHRGGDNFPFSRQ